MTLRNRLTWVVLLALVPRSLVGQDPSFQKAFELYQAGAVLAAKQVLTDALTRSPTALDFSLLGTIEAGEADWKAAEKHLRAALHLQPGLPGTRYTLATVLEKQGNTVSALRLYQQVISETPNNAEVLLSMGRLEVECGHLKEAKRHLERAEELLQHDSRPLLVLARIEHLKGNREAALALALKAKSLQPDNPYALYAVGALCLEMDLFKDAIANLQRAADLEPENKMTLYALGAARLGTRNYASAEEIFQALLERQPHDAQTAYALGATYFVEGKLDLANKYFQQSVRSAPEQVESYYYLSRIAEQNEDHAKALDLLKLVVNRQPAHVAAHIALGMQYKESGQLTEAEHELVKAVDLEPDSKKAHYQLGLVLNLLGRAQESHQQMAIAEHLRQSDDKVSWELAPAAGEGQTAR